MEPLLQDTAHCIALIIEAIAILLISVGVAEALVKIVAVLCRPAATNVERRAVWLMFARWLVAGLTFQLAADIINTSFAPTWDELGRLASIAVIRTFLSFFLDHEVEETRGRQHPGETAVAR